MLLQMGSVSTESITMIHALTPWNILIFGGFWPMYLRIRFQTKYLFFQIKLFTVVLELLATGDKEEKE